MSSTLRWFKSSYSSSSGGDCIEVAFDWRKSSYSNASGGDCVEVAACPHSVHVRDSKVPDGPDFAVAPDAWSAFLTWAD
ncbi:DUF397 domain-containing protein [Streptomyces sp. WZ.A104]|uniref:DUF397 domain-containing protein n=1 Tax=Streptomyces sp. WZ.A104 TaxID=2023771 RepID=UPI000BBBE6EE|nr:DUF397 domain-containing protein [Streptomyces sp. WZ.A104]PCG87913.1 DUF397 domain-containing protein [Streptomyces sp. WZ.A104]